MMTGKNIRLRAVEPEDIDLLYQWENDPMIWPVSNTLTPFSHFALEQYVLNAQQDIFTARQLRLMIDLQHENKTIGTADLFDYDPHHRRAGLGIMIRKEYRNKGYAGEALDMIIAYGFNTLALHQIYCNIHTDNEPSLKLFRSRGFEVAGIKKEWVLQNNRWLDEYLLQLIDKRKTL